LEQIRSLKVSGLVGTRLEVNADDGELMLSCDQPTSRLYEIARWIADHSATPRWTGGVVGRSWGQPSPADGEIKEEIDKVLATDCQHMLLPGAPLLFSLAVLYEEDEAQVGWMAYTEDRLHWLPRGAVQPLRMSLSGSAVVVRDGPQRTVHLRLGAGKEFFWLVGDADITNVLREVGERSSQQTTGPRKVSLGSTMGPDRRHTYRVPAVVGIDMGMTFHREVEGLVMPVEAELANLSLHGFGLRMIAEPKVGEEILVMLMHGEEPRELRATAIHRRLLGNTGTWFAGYVFNGNWGDIELITRAHWLSLQQAARNQWRQKSKVDT